MTKTGVPGGWSERGLCANLDEDTERDRRLQQSFFGLNAAERRDARNLCVACPVRRDCLAWALERPEIWGVWGGLDEDEIRRALWVNSSGKQIKRCRFPQCPYCKSWPNKLVVVVKNDPKTDKPHEHVSCQECEFTWRSPTSVTAVKAYWRMVKTRAKEHEREQAAQRRETKRQQIAS